MPATDQQVQQYVNERIRPRAEQLRALLNAITDDKAAMDDVYAACNQVTPTWADTRTDGPPHLLVPADVLQYDAILFHLKRLILGAASDQERIDSANTLANAWSLVGKACVRPVGS